VDVSAILGQMAQLEHHLDGHIRYILAPQRAAPSGATTRGTRCSPTTAAATIPPLKRLEEAQASGQSRGATLNEVRRAAEGLRTQATGEMDRILAPVPIGAAGMVMAVGGGTGHVALEDGWRRSGRGSRASPTRSSLSTLRRSAHPRPPSPRA
jgi:hypothetical protein